MSNVSYFSCTRNNSKCSSLDKEVSVASSVAIPVLKDINIGGKARYYNITVPGTSPTRESDVRFVN